MPERFLTMEHKGTQTRLFCVFHGSAKCFEVRAHDLYFNEYLGHNITDWPLPLGLVTPKARLP